MPRNYSEKSINNILDYISASRERDLLQQVYETTLRALLEIKNDRLWFKTNLKVRVRDGPGVAWPAVLSRWLDPFAAALAPPEGQ